jgi:hypothetical protein
MGSSGPWPGTAPHTSSVRLPSRVWPPAILVAVGWLAAGVVSAVADGYDEAPAWLLLVNQLLLLPAAVIAAYALGWSLGGRLLAPWFGAVLVLLPLAGWLYALAGFRDTYVDHVLVHAYGLSDDGRFAAGALLLVAALLIVRSLEGDLRAGAAAGIAAGGAMLAEPSAALFLLGPALAYAAARAPRPLAAFAATAVPLALVTLLVQDVDPGLDISRDAFSANMAGLREYLWSNRVLQWLPIAGAIGLARRSIPVAALVGGWFGAFALAEGASPNLPVEDGSYLVAFVPALPAFCLLAAAIPLLVPGVPARLGARVATR